MTRGVAVIGCAMALSGCVVAPVAVERPATSATVGAPAAAAPAGFQYLYGSGEGAAISVQAWRGVVGYVAAQVRARPIDSVVLASGTTLATPRFVPCGGKPLAAVFDVDETVLLNLGFEYDAAKGAPYNQQTWEAWEHGGAAKTMPSPGAGAALRALRGMGVTVVFNSNRSAVNAAGTEAALDVAGLGPARHGETLFLQGDDTNGSKKDGRRATIASRYCVVAMGGDQLGDFSDLFNTGQRPLDRRAEVTTPPVNTKWGNGWFILPNPVYGTALKGGVDDIFPPDKRWTPRP